VTVVAGLIAGLGQNYLSMKILKHLIGWIVVAICMIATIGKK
jgi:hypothetical protein